MSFNVEEERLKSKRSSYPLSRLPALAEVVIVGNGELTQSKPLKATCYSWRLTFFKKPFHAHIWSAFIIFISFLSLWTVDREIDHLKLNNFFTSYFPWFVRQDIRSFSDLWYDEQNVIDVGRCSPCCLSVCRKNRPNYCVCCHVSDSG